MAKDDLIVEIGADIADLEKGLARAKKKLGEFDETTQKTSKKFAVGMKDMKAGAIALGVAVTAAGVAIGAMTKQVIENAKEQRLWAKRLSVSQESFSALTAVARRFGAGADDVGDSIKDLNERIADAARGNKTYEEALNMVGLASKDLINLPVEDQFLRVAGAIGKMSNAGDRNFVTAELMADAGFRLLEVFRLGEDGIRKMAGEVIKANEALSSFEMKQLEDAGKASKELEASFAAFKNVLVIGALPAIREMTRLLKDASDFYGKMFSTTSADVQSDIDKINATLARLGDPGAMPEGSQRARNKWLETNRQINSLLNERAKLTAQLKSMQKTDESGPEIAQGPEQGPAPRAAFIPSDDVLTQNIDSYKAFMEKKVEADEALRIQELNDAFIHAMDLGDIERQRLADEEQARQDELSALFEHAMDVGEIKKQQAKAEEDIEKKKNAFLYKEREKALSNLSSLMASESRKMFEVGKAAAIAQTIISTIESAQASFTGMVKAIPGPVGIALGGAAAGAAIAAGMARVQAISSTSMGGGGGGAGGAGGAGGGAGAPPAPEVINQSNFDITFAGDGAVPQSDVRSLIGQINEELDNGAQLGSINVR